MPGRAAIMKLIHGRLQTLLPGRSHTLKPKSRQLAFYLATVLLLAPCLVSLRIDAEELKDISENPLFDELKSTPETDNSGWRSIYLAYSCVVHHATRAAQYRVCELRTKTPQRFNDRLDIQQVPELTAF